MKLPAKVFYPIPTSPGLATPPKIELAEMLVQGGARMASTSVLAIHHGVVDQLGRSLPWHLFGKWLGFQIGRGREFKSRPLHIIFPLKGDIC